MTSKQRAPRRAAPSPNPFTIYTQPMRPMDAASRPASRQMRPVAAMPIPAVPPRPVSRPARPMPRPKARPRRRWWLIALVSAMATFGLAACLILSLGLFMIYGSGKILPGVETAGVTLGNLSREDAAAMLATTWAARGIVLSDGSREFPVEASMLGVDLDTGATALAAYQFGRASGGIPAALRALAGKVHVEPVVTVDATTAQAALQTLADQVSQPAINAGVQVVNGQVQERLAQAGRALDVGQTIARLQQDPARELADGDLDLVMQPIQPSILDAGPMVAAASALLASPLRLQAWDPIDDSSSSWTVDPAMWSQWLTAESDPSALLGLRLGLDPSALQIYLSARNGELGSDKYLKMDESIQTLQNDVASGTTDSVLRVYERDRQHIVQPGETITSIAWDYGVPYLYIQQANPDAGENLSAGQTITVPSPDAFMDYPPVYGKRIVVSISQQHAWVYENGNLKWDWVVSTGISSSPTWPGLYQIISHEPNAYAGNWDLWMPHFLGVYRPIPGADFTNGFHGFPTRGGNQLLWTNSLGTRVTYGCILLSNDNVQLLYDWAEDGVVVDIQA